MFKRNVSKRTKLLLLLMALFILTIPTSSQVDNCCHVGRQCDTDEEWTDGYYAFRNNQCAAASDSLPQAPAAPAPPQPAPTVLDDADNCCFVDRQCNTDEEWVNGFNAYQNDQCGSPSHGQPSSSSQSQRQPETSAQIDNCCLSGWQCNADEEWVSGYFAFQHDHCFSQSHWEEQKRKRQNGNRQPRQSGNQQQPSGNQQAQAKEDRSRPPALEQNSEGPPSKNQNSATVGEEPGTYQATIDLTSSEGTNHELEDGSKVYIRRRHVTLEEKCAAYPNWPLCP